MNDMPQRLPLVSPGDRLQASLPNGRPADSKALPSYTRAAAIETGRPLARWRLWLRPRGLLLLGIVALGLGGLGGVMSGPNASAPASRAAADGSAPVAAEGVVEGARRTVSVYPEVSGTLARLHVRENQEVRAGELLFELANEVEQQRVALARAQVQVAAANEQHAGKDAARSRALVGSKGAISQQDYDSFHYRKLEMQARVEEAQAQLRLAAAELARTQVRARQGGRVLQVYVEPGEMVGPGRKQAVLLLADMTKRRVRAFVEELDVARVRVGQPARVTADGYAGQEFAGRVAVVVPVMGKSGPQSDAPQEYKDIYFREVLIDLELGADLPLNLRVRVHVLNQDPERTQ
jgi:multidrug efflux pump subunit AcrA (membrane-fusion protein)